MKYLSLLLICVSFQLRSQHITVKSGNWNDPSVWSNNLIPSINDSCFISSGKEVKINIDSAQCRMLTIEGSCGFSAGGRTLHSNVVHLLKQGELASDNLGSVHCDRFIVEGQNRIEAVNLNVRDTLVIDGTFTFFRKSGLIELNHVHLHSSGQWLVPDDQSFIIKGNIISNGLWSAGNGWYEFPQQTTLSGTSDIQFNKIRLLDSFVNKGKMAVIEEIDAASQVLSNEAGARLEFRSTPSNTAVQLDLRAKDNVVEFSRSGPQKLPQLIGSTLQKLLVSNVGNFQISDSVNIADQLVIGNKCKMVCTSGSINGFGTAQLILKDEGQLSFFSNDSLSFKKFVQSFSQVSFNDLSEVTLEAKSNLLLPGINYQNLVVESGGLAIEVKVDGDSLFVNDFEVATGITLLLDHQVLTISGDFSGSGSFVSESSAVSYRGVSKQKVFGTDYNRLVIENTGKDTLNLFGNYVVDELEVNKGSLQLGSLQVGKATTQIAGNIIVGASQLHITDTLINYGKFTVFSDYAKCVFDGGIKNSGLFYNRSLSDHSISQILKNNGVFKGCEGTGCTWTITDNLIFEGMGEIVMPRMEIETAVIAENKGKLKVSSSLEGDGLLRNTQGGELSLGMSAEQAKAKIDASDSLNTVIYYGENDQAIKHVNKGSYYNLHIAGRGSKNLESDVEIRRDLIIEAGAALKAADHFIKGNQTGQLIMKDSAELMLGSPLVDFSTPFPLYFTKNNIELHSSSTVNYAAMKDQWVSTLPIYGSIRCEDGVGSHHQRFFLQSDTLHIKGALDLAESSIDFLVGNGVVDIEGDFKGSGNLIFNKGKFFLAGNAQSKGSIVSGTSSFYYDGVKDQQVMRGQYYDLIVAKKSPSKAVLNAGTGFLEVKNQLDIKKGVLEIKGEKVEVNKLLVAGEVRFSSKVQEKLFKDVIVHSTGYFNNNYGVKINVEGDFFNEGIVVIKGLLTIKGKEEKASVLLSKQQFVVNQIELIGHQKALKMSGYYTIKDSLKLDSSSVCFSDAILNFGRKGVLVNSSENNQLSGDAHSYIQLTLETDSGQFLNVGGLGLDFSFQESQGNIMLKRSFKPVSLFNDTLSIKKVIEVKREDSLKLSGLMTIHFFEYEKTDSLQRNLYGYASQISKDAGFYFQPSQSNVSQNSVSFFQLGKPHYYTVGPYSASPLALNFIEMKVEKVFIGIKINCFISDQKEYVEYEIYSSYEGNENLVASFSKNESSSYTTVIENSTLKEIRYVLKGIKYNGDVEWLSDCVLINNNLIQSIKVLGNEIHGVGFSNEVAVRVVTIEGKVIVETKVEHDTVLFLPEKGVYVLQFFDNYSSHSIKILSVEEDAEYFIRD